MKSPSKAQIEFANEIACKLNLDFPKGDQDFTAQAYYKFISSHIKEYKDKIKTNHYVPILENENDIFWGYDLGLWEY